MAKVLSDQQKKFGDEFLISFNATQSAIKAGYSKKTAYSQGQRLLKNVELQKYLQAGKEELRLKSNITKEKVLAEYSKIGFFDIRKIFTVDGGLMPIRDLDDDSAGAIAGIESQDVTFDEMVIGKLHKIKISDKRAALDSICKMLGYNAPEKIEANLHLSDKPIVFR